VPTLRSSKVWQIWRFAMFLSILLPTPSLYRTTISYENESRRWQTDFLSFCPFGISIFPFLTIGIICTKNVFYPIIIPYFLTPSFFPFGATDGQTEGQTTFFTPCYLSSFFSPLRRGALPAGATLLGWPTMGWMADWTRSGFYRNMHIAYATRKRKVCHRFEIIYFRFSLCRDC
jgi:hypothetical protein